MLARDRLVWVFQELKLVTCLVSMLELSLPRGEPCVRSSSIYIGRSQARARAQISWKGLHTQRCPLGAWNLSPTRYTPLRNISRPKTIAYRTIENGGFAWCFGKKEKKMKKKNAHLLEKKNKEVKNNIDSWFNEKSKLHVAYLWHLIQAKKKRRTNHHFRKQKC